MTFEQVLEFIRSQNDLIIYGILFASAFIENIFPPFPGDAMMLAGAYLAGAGNITYIGVLLSVTAGGMAGAMTLYHLGKTSGRRLFVTGKGRYLVKGNLARAENMFGRYGSVIILVSRFLPGIRSAIAIAAGVVRFDGYRMTLLTAISFLLWYGMLTGLMVFSKSNWRLIIDIVREYNIVLLIIGLVILAGWITGAFWKRKRNSK